MVITDWIAVFIQFWSTTKKAVASSHVFVRFVVWSKWRLWQQLISFSFSLRFGMFAVFFCCHYCHTVVAAAVASSFTIVIVTVTDRVLLVDLLHSILMFYPNVTLNAIAVVFILLLFFSYSVGICSYSKILLKLPEQPHGSLQIVSEYLFYYSCLFTWDWSLGMSGGCNNILV